MDMETGRHLYKQLLAVRKQRETDVNNMTAGTQVKCSDIAGHEDKLTLDHIYEVLDERKKDLLIRLRDNRGKEYWFPKSYFELIHLRKV